MSGLSRARGDGERMSDQMPAKVVERTETLKAALSRDIPDAEVTEDICKAVCFLDIKKAGNHAVVEVREAGYGISDIRNVEGFEGPEHVFHDEKDALKKIREILGRNAKFSS